MKTNWNKCLSFLGSLLLVWHCSNINDPTSTILALPYQPPEITFITTSSNSFSIEVRSYLRKTGDLEGFIIYLSNVSTIDRLSTFNLNDYENIRDKPGYFTNIPTNNIRIGSKIQIGSLNNVVINNTNELHLAVTVYGQNDTFAQINGHQGFIESSPTRLNAFYLKKIFAFSLSNFSSGMSTLGYQEGEIFITNLSNDQMTNLLFVTNTNNGNGDYAIFQMGMESTFIQSLGYSDNFNLLTTLPTNGYTRNAVPALSNYVYAVKNGNQYFKLHVTNVFIEMIGGTTSTFVSGEVTFINMENVIHF